MRKILRSTISMGLSMVLMASFVVFGNVTFVKGGAPEISNPRVENQISTWDCVYFGNYYINNSTDKEPIMWRVLSVTDDDMYLLSDRIIESGSYHTTNDAVTWEKCQLRSWLNDDFLNAAFTSEEQQAIKTTLVKDNPHCTSNTTYGNDTLDKVFLLDTQDCIKTEYGFDNEFFPMDYTLMGKNTPYVIENGGFNVSGIGEYYESNSTWWLRSGGLEPEDTEFASVITPAGGGGAFAKNTNNFGIRPVLHLDKEKTDVWSYAGTINSENVFNQWKPAEEGIELNGYQVNYQRNGMRTIYTVSDTIDGKEVVERGLIYGVGGYVDESEINIESVSPYVYSCAANEYGSLGAHYSDSLPNTTSYALTLKFAGNSAKEFNTEWYVRAYAKLSDGTYSYSDVQSYQIYGVADELYQGKQMDTLEGHDYLYNNILKKVNPNYELIPY